MSTKMVEKLRRRVIKSFMDILILSELKKEPMSGYDVIKFIHNKFGMLLSSGTAYSVLYSLEREGLIKAVQNPRKRIYTLTEKGEQDVKAITKTNAEIQGLLRNILTPKD